jgi:predicted nucleic acid-binding protein
VIFLLDTTAFSDLMRDNPRTEAQLAAIAPADRVVICSIVWGEVRFGIERLPPGKRREGLETKALRLFAAIACEPVSPAVGDQYGKIKATTQGMGLSLDENDLWIAATARSLAATLVSRDTDFHRVDGLSVTDWTK